MTNPIYTLLQKSKYFVIDNFEKLFNLRDELTPPRSMIFIGNGNFKRTGQEFLKYFVELGGLKKNDRILDVGCGLGRMAVPLTEYVNSEGSYEGIDIVENGITWCKTKITPMFPNFHFQLADVYNKYYNPDGYHQPVEYKFPFDDNSFDFIFLTSVFTHMLPPDMENYLSEISRVLKKDGKCLITFFLLNEESLNHINNKQGKFSFKHTHGNCRIEEKDMPESVVGYDESLVRNMYNKFSLKITDPIHWGSWCGRKEYLSFQDIIIAEKVL